MTQEQKDLLLQIPNKLDDTLYLYVDGVFVDRLDVNQVNQYRINVLKYIYKTGDSSILNRFYFIGHKDTNDMPGEEIKIKMDENKFNISFDDITSIETEHNIDNESAFYTFSINSIDDIDNNTEQLLNY